MNTNRDSEAEADIIFGHDAELRRLPWNAPVFVITPGRHYAALFFMNIPPGREFPRGGDITALLWRFERLADEWVFCWRFRYYAGQDAWSGADKKSWQGGKFRGSEAVAITRMVECMKRFSQAAQVYFMADAPDIETVLIHGDWQKFHAEVTRQNPSWMHMQASCAA